VLVAALGAVLVTLSGVVACRSVTPPAVGGATVAALASATPAATAPSVPVRNGSLPVAGEVVPPVGLRIPAMELNATVDAVGVDAATGEFDVPPSVDRVGWYRFGPGLEATAGSIVVAGHVDSSAQGKGAFFKLDRLAPGDRITLAPAAGKVREFRVVGRERYEKTKIPLAKYFALSGATRLTLITCGGPFDAGTGHHRDNVVVTAVPV
jgi:hypothetical protein